MGWFSKVVVILILGWTSLTFYTIYQSVTISKAADGEQVFANVLSIGDAFDLHLFITDTQSIQFDRISFVIDPFLESRVIPSFVGKNPCQIASSPSLLLSARGTYGATLASPPWFKRWLSSNHTKHAIENVSICKTESRNAKSPFVMNYTTNPTHLGFSVPASLHDRSSLFIVMIATKTIQWPAEMSVNNLVVMPIVVEKLSALLKPDRLERPKRFLLSDPSGHIQTAQLAKEFDSLEKSTKRNLASEMSKLRLLSLPKEVTVGVVVESAPLPASSLQKLGLHRSLIRIEGDVKYKPPLILNSLTSPRDEFVFLEGQRLVDIASGQNHSDQNELNIRIRYIPMEWRGWMLQHLVVNSLDQMEAGFATYDIDSLKMMVGGGNPLLIISTFVISALHLLFSFLAVSSDVSYWREHSDQVTIGISPSAIVLEIVLSFFIALYLYDSGQSKFVLLTVAGRILLFVWKWWKIRESLKVNKEAPSISTEKHNVSTLLRSNGDSDSLRQRKTVRTTHPLQGGGDSTTEGIDMAALLAYETRCMWRLLLCTVPVILSVCVYQLFYVAQAGWKSWLIHSLAVCAYAGGFVAMTPQLFRNYKLQSVDHLPWASLTYQALNAFVDDFFSFIVRMPQMHRISVFRDDIIFIIYAVQRYMYRKRRIMTSKID